MRSHSISVEAATAVDGLHNTNFVLFGLHLLLASFGAQQLTSFCCLACVCTGDSIRGAGCSDCRQTYYTVTNAAKQLLRVIQFWLCILWHTAACKLSIDAQDNLVVDG